MPCLRAVIQAVFAGKLRYACSLSTTRQISLMQTFSLEGHPFIALNNLLKVEGLAESGAAAKQAVANGEVLVDGQVELRKRCKLVAGQVVSYQGQAITITE